MTALVQVPTFEEALLGVERCIGGNLPDRTATLEWPYYEMTRKSVEELVKQNATGRVHGKTAGRIDS